MGQLVDGHWHAGWFDPDAKGAFERPKTQFRSREADGNPARYHLYVSYACPWAHRTLIVRAERGLAIPVTVVGSKMGDDGWPFGEDGDDDPLFGAAHLRDVYTQAKRDYTGRVTVPVLWDREKATIVNNESREVMRILDTQFEGGVSLAPPALVPNIDDMLTRIYEPVNNGVYKAGFATKQGAYEEAVKALFDELDRCETILGEQRYLCGDTFTEADVALFTTLIRFDLVYYAHFKCNVRRIQDYPHLWGYTRDIYQRPAVRPTVHFDHIKTHYYWSQSAVNPTRVVPVGPFIDFDAPSGR